MAVTKGQKKLNEFTVRVINIDGTGQDERKPMFIETTGKLRLFIEMPAYVIDGVAKSAGRTVEIMGTRLYARDPDELREAATRMYWAYRTLVIEQKREKVIAVAVKSRLPGVHNMSRDFSFISHALVLALDFKRFWQSEGKLYFFDEDEERSMRGVSALDGARIIPYTDEAWAALNSIQATLIAGTQRLEALLGDDKLPLLLAGVNAQALLGVDTQGNMP